MEILYNVALFNYTLKEPTTIVVGSLLHPIQYNTIQYNTIQYNTNTTMWLILEVAKLENIVLSLNSYLVDRLAVKLYKWLILQERIKLYSE